MTGRLTDTYASALQHDLVDLPEDTVRFGVVRQQTRWFAPYVDENLSALGPPTDLFDEFRDRRDELADEGLDDAEAHNRAWADVEYDRRYRDHLVESADAQAALDRVRERLSAGDDVVLVCYENTDEKRCHRTLLREYLAE